MSVPTQAAKDFVGAILNRLKDTHGIRAEDAIHVAAATSGEACLLRGRHFDIETTEMLPWQPILSDPVNRYIGESPTNTFENVAEDSVFGILYRRLLPAGFARDEFPDLWQVFSRNLDAAMNKGLSWGFVALSVPKENHPSEMSIKIAYEWREIVDAICQHYEISDDDKPALCANALAEILIQTRNSIDHRIALLLASEIVVGVAKHVPMSRHRLQQPSPS